MRSIVKQIHTTRKTGHLLLIAGGAHPSGAPGECLAAGFDAVFCGEADRSFPYFMRRILTGEDWRNTPGTIWDKGRLSYGCAWPPPVDLDQCSTTAPNEKITGDIEITRGCFYHCGYCQTPRIFAGTVRHRSLASIIAEAGKMRHHINFISPNALSYGATRPGEINEPLILQMLSTLREQHPEKQINFGIFPSEIRPDYIRPGLVRELKPLINNKYLAIGVQSASDRVLQAIAREHTVADVEKAVEILLAEGFNVLMDFIFGLPGEDEQAVQENLRFLRKWLSSKGKIRPHIFSPLPGTPFARQPAGKLHPALREFFQTSKTHRIVTP